jgi:hypothetical protein
VGTGGDQGQRPRPVRVAQREVLGDGAAVGRPDRVHPLDAEPVQQQRRVVGHLVEPGRRRPAPRPSVRPEVVGHDGGVLRQGRRHRLPVVPVHAQGVHHQERELAGPPQLDAGLVVRQRHHALPPRATRAERPGGVDRARRARVAVHELEQVLQLVLRGPVAGGGLGVDAELVARVAQGREHRDDQHGLLARLDRGSRSQAPELPADQELGQPRRLGGEPLQRVDQGPSAQDLRLMGTDGGGCVVHGSSSLVDISMLT